MKQLDLSLTDRDILALKAIGTYTLKRGYAASYRDVMTMIGVKSTSTVHERLKRLEKRGLINPRRGGARTISLTPAGVEILKRGGV